MEAIWPFIFQLPAISGRMASDMSEISLQKRDGMR
jgi:hypothetical protein